MSSVSYADHGAISALRVNGYKVRQTFTYDPNRLQMTGTAVVQCTDNAAGCATTNPVLSLEYGYVGSAAGNAGGVNNNGNLQYQDVDVPGRFVRRQNYSYDARSRLKTFQEGLTTGGGVALDETYCYDEHGNRAVLTRSGLSALTPQVSTCDATNVRSLFPGNRINGSSYDQAGGLLADGRSSLRYNLEDQLAKSSPLAAGTPVTEYGYDGDGRRVTMKTGTAAPVVFVYDAMGALAAEYGGTSALTGTHYLHADHLGRRGC